jgi:hypothetical protein
VVLVVLVAVAVELSTGLAALVVLAAVVPALAALVMTAQFRKAVLPLLFSSTNSRRNV